jgi:hypothetical protein
MPICSVDQFGRYDLRAASPVFALPELPVFLRKKASMIGMKPTVQLPARERMTDEAEVLAIA